MRFFCSLREKGVKQNSEEGGCRDGPSIHGKSLANGADFLRVFHPLFNSQMTAKFREEDANIFLRFFLSSTKWVDWDLHERDTNCRGTQCTRVRTVHVRRIVFLVTAYATGFDFDTPQPLFWNIKKNYLCMFVCFGYLNFLRLGGNERAKQEATSHSTTEFDTPKVLKFRFIYRLLLGEQF